MFLQHVECLLAVAGLQHIEAKARQDRRNTLRLMSSSSMMSTACPAPMSKLLGWSGCEAWWAGAASSLDLQVNEKGRAKSGGAFQFQPSALLLHQSMHGGETQPGASTGFFGGEVRLKDVALNGRSMPATQALPRVPARSSTTPPTARRAPDAPCPRCY